MPDYELGCCTDKRLKTGTPCNEATCMVLPEGTTCADCVHVRRCVALFGQEAEMDYCQFFPRRFVARVS